MLIALALLIFEEDLLWKEQETSLFLHTPLFFREQMVVPGGLTTWVATFFSQFFYYPWLGTMLLCGCYSCGWCAVHFASTPSGRRCCLCPWDCSC